MNKRLSLEQKRARTGYIFILPWLLGLLFFFAVPILTSLMYSFSHVTIVQGGVNTRFAGLSYYKSALFSDERFIPLLVAALKEIAIQVPIIIIFALFARVITVDGESMVPTLQDQQRLIVSDMFYTPQYDDIVILYADKLVNESSGGYGKPIVKRVIGLPGDKIRIDFVKGVVYRNGEQLPDDYTNTPTNLPENFPNNQVNGRGRKGICSW